MPGHVGHAGGRWLRSGGDAGHARGTPGHAGHTGGRWLSSGGDAGHARGTPAHAGHAGGRWLRSGETLFTLGERLLTLVTLEDAGHARGTPAHAGHAGGCWLRLEGDAGVLLRSSWFASRVLVYPEDLSVCRL